MTPEELDIARAEEAIHHSKSLNEAAYTAARLAREGWMPPPPVDSDLLIVREIVAREWEFRDIEGEARKTRSGANDLDLAVRAALAAYKAGREAEAERAKVLLAALDDIRQHGAKFEGVRASAAIAAYKAGKEAAR